MQRFQSFIYSACITSEISHIFCCGIPLLFSLMSLLSGLGIIAVMPVGLDNLHNIIHNYEMPIIMASGFILALGWGLHYIAYRIDCRSTGCHHEPCTPKKKRSGKVLMIATALFILNVSVYFFFHAPQDHKYVQTQDHSHAH